VRFLVPPCLFAVCLAACGGAPAAAPGASLTTTAAPAAQPGTAAPEVLAAPAIELAAPDHATAFGAPVAFDGVPEGLYWPALARAFTANRGRADRAVLSAARNTRVLDVLRAVWTLREVDVEVQTLGPGNELHPLVLAKRPAQPPDGPTCHAAVFVSPEGKLRVAVPSGSVGVKDVPELVASIAQGVRGCQVRWLAFGGETQAMGWGWVFDVAYSVQASRVAPSSRFVLAEAMGGT